MTITATATKAERLADAVKWRRLGDGLYLDADSFEMVGKYALAKERYAAANEAYAKARELEA